MNTTVTTIQNLKVALLEFSKLMADSNTSRNETYAQIADNVWREKIYPFIKNENVTTWESDIIKKIINNPYTRLALSEKQAYCVAAAYQRINQETILVK